MYRENQGTETSKKSVRSKSVNNESMSTLVSLIIVQDGINVQAGKTLKINKCAGWNKAVQVGIFNLLLMQNKVLAQN